jgi:hypothetical protein
LGKNVLQSLAEAESVEVIRRNPKKQKPEAPKPSASKMKRDVSANEIHPRAVLGVNVMGMGTTGGQMKSNFSTIKSQGNRSSVSEDELEMEDKLPQQKQNLQLIAELQAKLKRSNPIEESNVDSVAEQKESKPTKPSAHTPQVQKKEPRTEIKQAKGGKVGRGEAKVYTLYL